jgi:hypothetical protein
MEVFCWKIVFPECTYEHPKEDDLIEQNHHKMTNSICRNDVNKYVNKL